ncbi:hypothetical protein [Andreprevotia chitinilytica]|uniref:hypothetical protein n=1 Tax=Andreprevotia chitinilytica TaxID=396808 RepID=UPI000553ED27|nr:hypothetical protein [Andreprevotia chitinilytica]
MAITIAPFARKRASSFACNLAFTLSIFVFTDAFADEEYTMKYEKLWNWVSQLEQASTQGVEAVRAMVPVHLRVQSRNTRRTFYQSDAHFQLDGAVTVTEVFVRGATDHPEERQMITVELEGCVQRDEVDGRFPGMELVQVPPPGAENAQWYFGLPREDGRGLYFGFLTRSPTECLRRIIIREAY